MMEPFPNRHVAEPDDADFFARGLERQRRMDLDGATAFYRRVAAINPQSARAYFGLGVCAYSRLDFVKALRIFDRVSILLPGNPDTLANIGVIFQHFGELDTAAALQRAAIGHAPKHVAAHINLAMALLRQGNWGEGFWEYEWRRARRDYDLCFPDQSKPIWQGEPLAGRTLLIYEEGGIGDFINFIGLAAALRPTGRIVARVRPQLVRLIRHADYLDEVVGEGESLPDYDVRVSVQGLLRRLDVRVNTLTLPSPYLSADPGVAAAWRERTRPSANLKVGLAWEGGTVDPHYQMLEDRDRNQTYDLVGTPYYTILRHTTLKALRPLFELPGIDWYNLQIGPARAQLHEAGAPPIIDLTADIHDFADTAALIDQLDLVISVDTAVLHLAGAMGKRAWLMLGLDGCWRWLRGRADSPWYPSVRIFRQKTLLEWGSVAIDVARALKDLQARRATRELVTSSGRPD